MMGDHRHSSRNYYSSRIPELDALRGFAIVMVLLRHYPILPAFKSLWIGVDVFFTLSGFLIAGILIRERERTGGIDVRRFLIRRGLKIYPSFYAFLFLTTGLALVAGWLGKPILFPQLDWKHFLREFFYLQSLTHGLWWHTWSLAVEEHFYLLFAGMVFFLGNRFNIMAKIALLFIPICLVLRLWVAHHNPEFSYILHYNNTFLRLDSLFFGVFLAFVYYGSLDRWRQLNRMWFYLMTSMGIIALTGWLAFIPLENMLTVKWGFMIVYLGFGAVLFGIMGLRAQQQQTPSWSLTYPGKLLLLLGRYSYNIYLWHALSLECLILFTFSLTGESAFSPMKWNLFAIYVTVSILMGIAMTRLVELPLLKWRDKRFQRPGKLDPRH